MFACLELKYLVGNRLGKVFLWKHLSVVFLLLHCSENQFQFYLALGVRAIFSPKEQQQQQQQSSEILMLIQHGTEEDSPGLSPAC